MADFYFYALGSNGLRCLRVNIHMRIEDICIINNRHAAS